MENLNICYSVCAVTCTKLGLVIFGEKKAKSLIRRKRSLGFELKCVFARKKMCDISMIS